MPVYHTVRYVGDVEIDDIAYVRLNQCVLGNHYIDDYTKNTKDKLLDLENDMKMYSQGNLDCTHCSFFNNGKCIYNSEWSYSNVLTCFRPKSHIKDSVIYHMQHYRRLLETDLYNEWRGLSDD